MSTDWFLGLGRLNVTFEVAASAKSGSRVWLAQMLAAMPSIFGDHSRIRAARIWR